MADGSASASASKLVWYKIGRTGKVSSVGFTQYESLLIRAVKKENPGTPIAETAAILITVRHWMHADKTPVDVNGNFPEVEGDAELEAGNYYIIELPPTEPPAKRRKVEEEVYAPNQVDKILALANKMTKMKRKELPQWDIVDRDEAVEIAYEAMRSSWTGWGSDVPGVDAKASIRALSAGWGMGIGKTVMGKYLFDKLTNRKPKAPWMEGGRVFKYVYIQINGGMMDRVLPNLDGENAVHPSTSAALRLLIGGLELDAESAGRLLKGLDLNCDWSMSAVVKILREHWGVEDETPLGLFVHVDEVQALVRAAGADRFLGVRRGFTHYLYDSGDSQAAAEGVFPMFYFSGVLGSDLLKADTMDPQTGKPTVDDSGQCKFVDIGLSPLKHSVDCLRKALAGKKGVEEFLGCEDILHGLAMTGHIPRAAVEWVNKEVNQLMHDQGVPLMNIEAGTLFYYVNNAFVSQYEERVGQLDENMRQQFALDVLRGEEMHEVPSEYKLLACSLTHGRLTAPPLIARSVLSKFKREADPTMDFGGDLLGFRHYGNDVLPMKRMEWKGFKKATALTLAMSLSRERALKFRVLFEFADTTKLGKDILSSVVEPSSWEVKMRKDGERLFNSAGGITWKGGDLDPCKVWLSAEGDAHADITLVLERQGGKKLLLFVQCKTGGKYAWSKVQKDVKKLADATAELDEEYELVYALALSRVQVAEMQKKKKRGGLNLELPVMVLDPTYFPPVLAACMRYACAK